jgi:hypothetical protein
MSNHEIQNLVFHKGQFTFIDGNENTGMIVSRYNIVNAKIEYYLIPDNNILAYQAARSHAEPDAHKKLGIEVQINNILHAKMVA